MFNDDVQVSTPLTTLIAVCFTCTWSLELGLNYYFFDVFKEECFLLSPLNTSFSLSDLKQVILKEIQGQHIGIHYVISYWE